MPSYPRFLTRMMEIHDEPEYRHRSRFAQLDGDIELADFNQTPNSVYAQLHSGANVSIHGIHPLS